MGEGFLFLSNFILFFLEYESLELQFLMRKELHGVHQTLLASRTQEQRLSRAIKKPKKKETTKRKEIPSDED